MTVTLNKPLSPSRAIRLPEVCHKTGASRATIWRWVKNDPSFPLRFQLSPGITCWDEGEILAWIDAKKAQRALNEPSVQKGPRHG
jgi:prophage regulatory protein